MINLNLSNTRQQLQSGGAKRHAAFIFCTQMLFGTQLYMQAGPDGLCLYTAVWCCIVSAGEVFDKCLLRNQYSAALSCLIHASVCRSACKCPW